MSPNQERPLRDACAIVGIGNTEYTRGTEKSTLQLHLEASLAAIADAGLEPGDIDAVMPHELADRCVEDFILNLGLHDVAFTSVTRQGGASFLESIQSACLAVATGVATNVLVPAGRRGYSEQRVSTGTTKVSPVMASVWEFERPYGNLVGSQWFALAAQRHMHEYGTTSEQFGHVAVTTRAHANLNPNALMHAKAMSLEDHQSSRMITTPFHLLDCSLESDGAAAVVITSRERAGDLRRDPVVIGGFGEGHGDPPTSIAQKRDMTFVEGMGRAAQRAYTMAGCSPDDIDCAQIYDGFTWFVVATLEAFGFCARGEGGPFVADGNTKLGARLPVNTHGGLLSEAHVSGANHVVEAVRQLRREVEPERQVAQCDTVLVTGEGNFGEGSALVVHR
jgi:acetyl-CoA acetyltransferase